MAAMRQRMYELTDGEYELPDEIMESYETNGGTPHLDGEYTVFGEVVEGLKIVKAIQGVRTDKYDRPVKDVKILKAEIVE